MHTKKTEVKQHYDWPLLKDDLYPPLYKMIMRYTFSSLAGVSYVRRIIRCNSHVLPVGMIRHDEEQH